MSAWSEDQLKAFEERKAKGRKLKPELLTVQPSSLLSADYQMNRREIRFVVHVEPMGAPRMTRRDKWKKRPCVERYFKTRDVVRNALSEATSGLIPDVPDEMRWKSFIPMPDSWTEKRKREMDGKPHRSRPDRDNIDKLVGDALFMEDGGIWRGCQEKRWCRRGEERIEITLIYDNP